MSESSSYYILVADGCADTDAGFAVAKLGQFAFGNGCAQAVTYRFGEAGMGIPREDLDAPHAALPGRRPGSGESDRQQSGVGRCNMCVEGS